jgi:hypothetical protein
MTPELPGRLSATSAKNRWLNQLRAAVEYAANLQPGRGCKIRSGRNPIIEADPAKGGAGASGMIFKGEYNQSIGYKKQNVVKVSSGFMAGTYIATVDVPVSTLDPEFPWLGGKWTMLSSLHNQWL